MSKLQSKFACEHMLSRVHMYQSNHVSVHAELLSVHVMQQTRCCICRFAAECSLNRKC